MESFYNGNWVKTELTFEKGNLVVSKTQKLSNRTPIRKVIITRGEKETLGINIKGGLENKCPCFVSRIFPGEAADRAGGLQIDDALLAINGTDIRGASHEEIVTLIKYGGTTVELVVKLIDDLEDLQQNIYQENGNYFSLESTPAGKEQKSLIYEELQRIPLKFCFIGKRADLNFQDSYLELFNSDGTSLLVLKAEDHATCSYWFSIIRNAIASSLQTGKSIVTVLNLVWKIKTYV